MRMWLCNRKITTVGEVLTKPLTRTQVSTVKIVDWDVKKLFKQKKFSKIPAYGM